MKEELFKLKFQKFNSVSHESTVPISDKKKYDGKHPIFRKEKSYSDEVTFVENYGNPLFSVFKEYFMVVIRKKRR